MKAIKSTLDILGNLIAFFLVTLPSLLYGITPILLIPLGWLIRLFVGRPAFSYQAGIIVLKLSTIILILVVPSVFYLYVSELLGWLFFTWMGIYLLIRFYTGTNERDKVVVRAWKQLDALEKKYERTYIKYHPVITIFTLALSIGGLAMGYYFGREMGLWIGVGIVIVVSCISPFAKETITKK